MKRRSLWSTRWSPRSRKINGCGYITRRVPGGLATDPSDSTHTEVLDLVRGVNVANVQAKSGQGMSSVSMEQVLSWNPEVILVSSSTGGEKNYQTILSDPSWSQVNAVKNGKVYITPLNPFGWFDRPPIL